MARQQSLSTLRTMLKAELGLSLNASITQRDDQLNTLLADTQKWLTGEYDWPFLADSWRETVPVSARYRTLPSTADINGASTSINFERPVKADIYYVQQWQPLDYGIGPEEYNTYDSDAGDTSTPIQRWSMAGATKYEVWPSPSEAMIIRFSGQREVPNLASSNAELDDILIVLFCAADLQAKAGAKSAPITLARAQQRLARLRGAYSSRDATYIVGSSPDESAVRTIPIKIAVHG